MNREHFWLVWNERRDAPTHKHSTPESARAEAERLAIANPGHEFHVLEVKSTACYARVHWHDYGEYVPF